MHRREQRRPPTCQQTNTFLISYSDITEPTMQHNHPPFQQINFSKPIFPNLFFQINFSRTYVSYD